MGILGKKRPVREYKVPGALKMINTMVKHYSQTCKLIAYTRLGAVSGTDSNTFSLSMQLRAFGKELK
jgi:hypothetical protein